jgi:hypothetical protein
MKARPGIFRPKKMIDHKAFKASCMKKIVKAILFLPCLQTRYKEIPIRTYRLIHTGPNTQLGGLKEGLFNSTYQVEIDSVVKTEPIIPASWQTIIDMASLA